jgi:hypothetical protein
MKTIITVLSLTIAGVLVATSAFAQASGAQQPSTQTPPPTPAEKKEAPDAHKSDKPAPADKTSKDAGSPAAMPAAAADFKGRHTMQGEVTKIDDQKGTFSMKTADGMTLDLHAPASALQGVKTGDRIAVEIAVKPLN